MKYAKRLLNFFGNEMNAALNVFKAALSKLQTFEHIVNYLGSYRYIPLSLHGNSGNLFTFREDKKDSASLSTADANWLYKVHCSITQLSRM
jgi:hypothetical protein